MAALEAVHGTPSLEEATSLLRHVKGLEINANREVVVELADR